jgi:ligand-binding sensor domain-containing protein
MKNILLFLFILIYSFSYGQWNNINNYTPENTGSNSLLSNSVYDITFDNSGYLWMITRNGITRFNGQNWNPFEQMFDYNCYPTCLVLDNNNDILLGANSSICRWDHNNDSLTTYISSFPSPSQTKCMFVASNGDIWIGTAAGVVWKHDQTITQFNTSDGLCGNFIFDFAETSNGDIWCANFLGLNIWDGTSWTSLYIGTPFNVDDGIYSLYVDQYDNVWAGGNGIFKFDGSTWQYFFFDICPYYYYTLSSETFVNSIISDNSGMMYFGIHYNGILTFDGQDWEWLCTDNVLKSNFVTSCTSDTTGKVWFGFDNGGIISISSGQYQYYTTSDALAEEEVYYIFEDSQNKLWFEALNGVSFYYNNTWESHVQDNMSNMVFNGIIKESNEHKICAARTKYIYRYYDSTWEAIYCFSNVYNIADIILEGEDTIYIAHYSGFTRGIGPNFNLGTTWTDYTNGLPSEHVNTLVRAPDNIIWIGTDEGLAIFDGTTIQPIIIPGEEIGNKITDLVFDYDSKLWVATNHGVGIYDGTDWEYITEINGLISNYVTCLEPTLDSAMWFGTGKGAALLKNNNWTYFTEQNGLIEDSILTIEETHNRNMWFGTLEGVSEIVLDTLQNIIIKQKQEKSSLSLFPNPASTTIKVSANDRINSVEIYKLNGILLRTISCKSNVQTIDISDLPAGSYFVRATGKVNTWVDKFVVIR